MTVISKLDYMEYSSDSIAQTNYVTSDLGYSNWVEKAPQLAESHIYSLTVFNNKLYGGTGGNGSLYEWNGTNAWVEKAPKLGAETWINSLIVFNNKLYGGTHNQAKLYEWNGINAWVEKAGQPASENTIYTLAIFNNKLYGGSDPNGRLYEWNGVDTWIQKADKFGTEIEIRSLVVFNNKLYGSTAPNGKLLEWNGTNAWIERASSVEIMDNKAIFALAVFNNKLYGAGASGKLYEWNGTDSWIDKTAGMPGTAISSLIVYNNKLYGATYGQGRLYEWNGSNAWVEKAAYLGGQEIQSLAILDNTLYGGTASNGRLYEWEYGFYLTSYSESTIKTQGSYSLRIFAEQTNSLNDTLTKTLTGADKINLSDIHEIELDVRASRTGTNFQLQIHDSGGTTSTKDITISSADTWETITWDISGIANADKDDIDSIIIKITNADADNTIYIDNLVYLFIPTYRISRNIEASFVDYLKENLQTDWSIDRVEKTFVQIYSIEIPSICIRVGDSIHSKVEIGTDTTLRNAHVLIDIFASSDGQRLDLKDYIIEKVRNGLDYYEIKIENGQVKAKVQNGRIRVLTIDETLINFGTDKNDLDEHDRYRHLIDLTISLGKMET